MKTCPYCGNEIQDEAIKCRYCGRDLRDWRPQPPALEEPRPASSGSEGTAMPSAPEGGPADGTSQVGEGALQFSHSGVRYLLGYGADYFGIWDRQGPGGPVSRFPRTDQGWAAAWREFSAMEPSAVPVALPSTGVSAEGAWTGPAEREKARLLESLASPWRRLGARVIDVVLFVVVGVIVGVLAFPSSTNDRSVNDAALWVFLLVFVGSFLYEVALIAIRGQTVGKMALGIKVVRQDTGEVPGWGRAFLRWLVPVAPQLVLFRSVGGLIALVIYLWLLWDPKRQGLHDKAAGTLVVEV